MRELAGYGLQDYDARGPVAGASTGYGEPYEGYRLQPGIMKRWDAGYAHTRRAFDRSPWIGEFDSLSEIILHEQMELPAAAE